MHTLPKSAYAYRLQAHVLISQAIPVLTVLAVSSTCLSSDSCSCNFFNNAFIIHATWICSQRCILNEFTV